jgi:hypothetical protein
VTILAGSLELNQTYQFVVHMVNRLDLTLETTGYLLVQIEETRPQMIAIA